MNELETDLDTLAAALDEGAVLVDVRQPDEYASVRVPGARLIPLDELGNRTEEIPREQRVYVICALGGRSLAAAKALHGAGWDAVSVAGGTNGWAEEGRPVETG